MVAARIGKIKAVVNLKTNSAASVGTTGPRERKARAKGIEQDSQSAACLKSVNKLLHADACLPNQIAKRAALDNPVHRYNDDSSVRPAHDMVRAGLMIGRKAKSMQCSDGFLAVDVARQLHAMDNAGSSTKCSRTLRGGVVPAARK